MNKDVSLICFNGSVNKVSYIIKVVAELILNGVACWDVEIFIGVGVMDAEFGSDCDDVGDVVEGKEGFVFGVEVGAEV